VVNFSVLSEVNKNTEISEYLNFRWNLYSELTNCKELHIEHYLMQLLTFNEYGEWKLLDQYFLNVREYLPNTIARTLVEFKTAWARSGKAKMP